MMPRYAAFVVRIWWSTTSSGRQWTAQVQHLPGGETWRFTEPRAFLGYMQNAAGNVDGPATTASDPALHQESLPDSLAPTEGEG